MLKDDLSGRINEQLSRIPVIDTHEHFMPRESGRDMESDVLREYTAHYISSDLVSAGLSLDELAFVRDVKHPLDRRWRVVEPYWQACRFTGYARALDLSVRGIYQIDGIQRHTLVPLNEAFQKARQPGHYRRVMKELCNIECCVCDSDHNALTDGTPLNDDHWARRAWQPVCYYWQCPPLNKMNERSLAVNGQKLNDLDQLIAMLDDDLAAVYKKGVHIIKIAAAYMRSLHFPEVSYTRARKSMLDFLNKAGKKPDLPAVYPKDVQNYMMHEILKRAHRGRWVVQVHTGLQEGNGNVLANSFPLHLTNLLLKYTDATFDLFHIGYPFIGETAALAKNFANVTIDMCWSHIIAPAAARRALDEFIDAVPFNKISAFGGDYLFIDGVYGHLKLAIENTAIVLADKVRSGVMDEDQAYVLGRHLFYDNPKRILRV